MTDFLDPLRNSAAFDIYEYQLNQLFINMIEDLFLDKITDIYNYGTPQYGSALVLERFIKQIGLVVLRRPNTSQQIMRILYENWTALASKRGLAFLEFTLEMLWTSQWEVVRLWHSIDRKDQYPSLVTEFPTENSFLTSRIFVLMSQSIDIKELETLAPSLQRLIPANIVPEIGVRIPLNEDNNLEIWAACAMQGTQLAYCVPTEW